MSKKVYNGHMIKQKIRFGFLKALVNHIEQVHDKTCKMTCASNEDSGHPVPPHMSDTDTCNAP